MATLDSLAVDLTLNTQIAKKQIEQLSSSLNLSGVVNISVNQLSLNTTEKAINKLVKNLTFNLDLSKEEIKIDITSNLTDGINNIVSAIETTFQKVKSGLEATKLQVEGAGIFGTLVTGALETIGGLIVRSLIANFGGKTFDRLASIIGVQKSDALGFYNKSFLIQDESLNYLKSIDLTLNQVNQKMPTTSLLGLIGSLILKPFQTISTGFFLRAGEVQADTILPAFLSAFKQVTGQTDQILQQRALEAGAVLGTIVTGVSGQLEILRQNLAEFTIKQVEKLTPENLQKQFNEVIVYLDKKLGKGFEFPIEFLSKDVQQFLQEKGFLDLEKKGFIIPLKTDNKFLDDIRKLVGLSEQIDIPFKVTFPKASDVLTDLKANFDKVITTPLNIDFDLIFSPTALIQTLKEKLIDFISKDSFVINLPNFQLEIPERAVGTFVEDGINKVNDILNLFNKAVAKGFGNKPIEIPLPFFKLIPEYGKIVPEFQELEDNLSNIINETYLDIFKNAINPQQLNNVLSELNNVVEKEFKINNENLLIKYATQIKNLAKGLTESFYQVNATTIRTEIPEKLKAEEKRITTQIKETKAKLKGELELLELKLELGLDSSEKQVVIDELNSALNTLQTELKSIREQIKKESQTILSGLIIRFPEIKFEIPTIAGLKQQLFGIIPKIDQELQEFASSIKLSRQFSIKIPPFLIELPNLIIPSKQQLLNNIENFFSAKELNLENIARSVSNNINTVFYQTLQEGLGNIPPLKIYISKKASIIFETEQLLNLTEKEVKFRVQDAITAITNEISKVENIKDKVDLEFLNNYINDILENAINRLGITTNQGLFKSQLKQVLEGNISPKQAFDTISNNFKAVGANLSLVETLPDNAIEQFFTEYKQLFTDGVNKLKQGFDVTLPSPLFKLDLSIGKIYDSITNVVNEQIQKLNKIEIDSPINIVLKSFIPDIAGINATVLDTSNLAPQLRLFTDTLQSTIFNELSIPDITFKQLDISGLENQLKFITGILPTQLQPEVFVNLSQQFDYIKQLQKQIDELQNLDIEATRKQINEFNLKRNSLLKELAQQEKIAEPTEQDTQFRQLIINRVDELQRTIIELQTKLKEASAGNIEKLKKQVINLKLEFDKTLKETETIVDPNIVKIAVQNINNNLSQINNEIANIGNFPIVEYDETQIQKSTQILNSFGKDYEALIEEQDRINNLITQLTGRTQPNIEISTQQTDTEINIDNVLNLLTIQKEKLENDLINLQQKQDELNIEYERLTDLIANESDNTIKDNLRKARTELNQTISDISDQLIALEFESLGDITNQIDEINTYKKDIEDWGDSFSEINLQDIVEKFNLVFEIEKTTIKQPQINVFQELEKQNQVYIQNLQSLVQQSDTLQLEIDNAIASLKDQNDPAILLNQVKELRKSKEEIDTEIKKQAKLKPLSPEELLSTALSISGLDTTDINIKLQDTLTRLNEAVFNQVAQLSNIDLSKIEKLPTLKIDKIEKASAGFFDFVENTVTLNVSFLDAILEKLATSGTDKIHDIVGVLVQFMTHELRHALQTDVTGQLIDEQEFSRLSKEMALLPQEIQDLIRERTQKSIDIAKERFSKAGVEFTGKEEDFRRKIEQDAYSFEEIYSNIINEQLSDFIDSTFVDLTKVIKSSSLPLDNQQIINQAVNTLQQQLQSVTSKLEIVEPKITEAKQVLIDVSTQQENEQKLKQLKLELESQEALLNDITQNKQITVKAGEVADLIKKYTDTQAEIKKAEKELVKQIKTQESNIKGIENIANIRNILTDFQGFYDNLLTRPIKEAIPLDNLFQLPSSEEIKNKFNEFTTSVKTSFTDKINELKDVILKDRVILDIDIEIPAIKDIPDALGKSIKFVTEEIQTGLDRVTNARKRLQSQLKNLRDSGDIEAIENSLRSLEDKLTTKLFQKDNIPEKELKAIADQLERVQKLTAKPLLQFPKLNVKGTTAKALRENIDLINQAQKELTIASLNDIKNNTIGLANQIATVFNTVPLFGGLLAQFTETQSIFESKAIDLGQSFSQNIEFEGIEQKLYPVLDRIESAWLKTVNYIKDTISTLESYMDKKGYEIQKDIAEGSPGTTQRIRQFWNLTATSVSENLDKISDNAEIAGQDIERSFSGNQLEALLKGLSLQAKEGIGSIGENIFNLFPDDFKNKLSESGKNLAKALPEGFVEGSSEISQNALQGVKSLLGNITEFVGTAKTGFIEELFSPERIAQQSIRAVGKIDQEVTKLTDKTGDIFVEYAQAIDKLGLDKDLLENIIRPIVDAESNLRGLTSTFDVAKTEEGFIDEKTTIASVEQIKLALKEYNNLIKQTKKEVISLQVDEQSLTKISSITDEIGNQVVTLTNQLSNSIKGLIEIPYEAIENLPLEFQKTINDLIVKGGGKSLFDFDIDASTLPSLNIINQNIEQAKDKLKEYQLQLEKLNELELKSKGATELLDALGQLKSKAKELETTIDFIKSDEYSANLAKLRQVSFTLKTEIGDLTDEITKLNNNSIKTDDDVDQLNLLNAKLIGIKNQYNLTQQELNQSLINKTNQDQLINELNTVKLKIAEINKEKIVLPDLSRTTQIEQLKTLIESTQKQIAQSKVEFKAKEIYDLDIQKEIDKNTSIFQKAGNLIKGTINSISSAIDNLRQEFPQLDNIIQATGIKGKQALLLLIGGFTAVKVASFAIERAFDFITDKVTEFASQTLEVTEKIDALRSSIKFFSESGEKDLAFIDDVSKRFNISIESSIEGFKSLTGAVEGTNITGEQTRLIYESLAQASRVYGLTSEQTSGAILALSQIASKGVVSMEELRQQLGERIPGAMGIAARSMGKTTQEFNNLVSSGELLAVDFLPNFARQLQSETLLGVSDALNTISSARQQFLNTVTELQLAIGEVIKPNIISGLQNGANILGFVANNLNNIVEIGQTVLLATILSLTGATNAFNLALAKISFQSILTGLTPAFNSAKITVLQLGNAIRFGLTGDIKSAKLQLLDLSMRISASFTKASTIVKFALKGIELSLKALKFAIVSFGLPLLIEGIFGVIQTFTKYNTIINSSSDLTNSLNQDFVLINKTLAKTPEALADANKELEQLAENNKKAARDLNWAMDALLFIPDAFTFIAQGITGVIGTVELFGRSLLNLKPQSNIFFDITEKLENLRYSNVIKDFFESKTLESFYDSLGTVGDKLFDIDKQLIQGKKDLDAFIKSGGKDTKIAERLISQKDLDNATAKLQALKQKLPEIQQKATTAQGLADLQALQAQIANTESRVSGLKAIFDDLGTSFSDIGIARKISLDKMTEDEYNFQKTLLEQRKSGILTEEEFNKKREQNKLESLKRELQIQEKFIANIIAKLNEQGIAENKADEATQKGLSEARQKIKDLTIEILEVEIDLQKDSVKDLIQVTNDKYDKQIDIIEQKEKKKLYEIEKAINEGLLTEEQASYERLMIQSESTAKEIKQEQYRLIKLMRLRNIDKEQQKKQIEETKQRIRDLKVELFKTNEDIVDNLIGQIESNINIAIESQNVKALEFQSLVAQRLMEGAISQKEASDYIVEYKEGEINRLIAFDENRIKALETLKKTIGLTADQEKELVKARNQLATSKFEAPKKLYDEFIQSAQDGIDLLEFSAKQRESSIQQLVNSGVISRKEADRQLAESNRQLNRDRYNNDYDYFLRLQEFNKENPTIEGYKEIEQRAKALNDLQNQLLQDEYQKQQELIDLANEKLNQQAKSLDLRNQELDLQLKLLDIQTKALDSQQRLFEAQNRLNTALANLETGRDQLLIDELNYQLEINSNEKEQLRIKKEIYALEKKATQDKVKALIAEQKQQLISLDIEENRMKIEAQRTAITNQQALNQAQNQILQQQIALNDAKRSGDKVEIEFATQSLDLAYQQLNLTQQEIAENNKLLALDIESAKFNRQSTEAEQRLAREQLAQEESFRLNAIRKDVEGLENKLKNVKTQTDQQLKEKTAADRQIIVDESTYLPKVISDTGKQPETATEDTAQEQLMTLEEIKRDNKFRAELEDNLFDLLQKGVIGNQGQIIGNPENNQKIKDTFENVTLKTLNLPQMVTPTITIDTPKQLQFQNTLLDGLNKIYQQLINIGGQKPIINQTNEFVNQFASNNEKELLRQARNQTLTDLNNLFAQMA